MSGLSWAMSDLWWTMNHEPWVICGGPWVTCGEPWVTCGGPWVTCGARWVSLVSREWQQKQKQHQQKRLRALFVRNVYPDPSKRGLGGDTIAIFFFKGFRSFSGMLLPDAAMQKQRPKQRQITQQTKCKETSQIVKLCFLIIVYDSGGLWEAS